MILLLVLALLFVPPALITVLPTPWLALAVPVGALGLYLLTAHVADSFAVNDPGPAGIFVLAFFNLVFVINLAAGFIRLMRSL